MSLFERWRVQLDRLKDDGRYRTLAAPAGIDFSSNDYLGYAKHPWPTSDLSCSGAASRLLPGHHPIWDEVEAALATWHHAESALVFTSGYVANEGLLGAIIEPSDRVFSDELNHASLIDGIRLSRAEKTIYPHVDAPALDDAMRQQRLSRSAGQAWFIVTESLFGMDGDIAPLGDLAALAEQHDAHLIVDEAHATGCFGKTGGGLVDALGLRDRVLASIHTGGKALAVPGAYVVGPRLLRETLVNRCRHFIFTTALAPQVGAWWLSALAKTQGDEAARKCLRERIRIFRHATHGLSVGGTEYLATFLLGADAAAMAAARTLQDAGFDIRAIRPPTVPDGTARLRVSIHADQRDEDLLRLADALSRFVS